VLPPPAKTGKMLEYLFLWLTGQAHHFEMISTAYISYLII